MNIILHIVGIGVITVVVYAIASIRAITAHERRCERNQDREKMLADALKSLLWHPRSKWAVNKAKRVLDKYQHEA